MGFKGHKAHIRRLRKLTGPEFERRIGSALFAAGELVQVTAQTSITTGAVSGKGHVPSLPGEPPNNDTGDLAGNIETVQKSPILVEVSSNAPHAAIHEFGGTINHPGGTPYFMRDGKPVFVSNKGHGAYHTLLKTKPHTIMMPARPYMIPARDKTRKEVVAIITGAVDSMVRGSGSK